MTLVQDPHSFAKAHEARINHIDLDLLVDFENKKLMGKAHLMVDSDVNAKELILDTKDLFIESVTDSAGNKLEYQLKSPVEHLGSPLVIPFNHDLDGVIITYSTGQNAEALQWLQPVQTSSKQHPFLFTQSQAILARSWIPLQDSPGIRFTYKAEINVPKGLMALMSAENPQKKSPDGIYTFNMSQPIPGYLMSLAVGDIAYADVGARTGVYAEPSMLEAARFEFSQMEHMLEIAEKLYGPYRWEQYDLIVLPPSFPFGGMENPRLTFATPTVIAGDRSLTSLVAHELAHSWSGNLVTNATWNDFWLNEGFTVYFEYRIMEALNGKSYSEMLAALSQQDLRHEVGEFMENGKGGDTKLKLNLEGRNPDEGVTTIAYDKGYFFLRYLEQLVGRKIFDAFLSAYFEAHAFQSNDTESFLEYMKGNLFEKNQIEPPTDIHEWVYEEGLPSTMPEVQSERFEKVDEVLRNWNAGARAATLDTAAWTTHEWLHFIRNLPASITSEQMEELDMIFHFTESGNAELLCAWFVHAIKHWYTAAFRQLGSFLVNTGRRKFLMPLYTELNKTEEGKRLGKEIYARARPNYHFVSSSSVDKLLGV